MGGKKNDKVLVKGIPRSMDLVMKAFFKLPLVNRWHPWIRADKTDMRWLPINQDIAMPDNAPMPIELVDRFIEEASHRIITDYCGCRNGFKCKNYPHDIGCLLMGDSALEAQNYPFREVGVAEAKEHARKALAAGLVPIVGKARADNYIFKIKDRGKLLTVCFCCECCCVTRFTNYMPLEYLEGGFSRLDGISITVTEECKACGKCEAKCYMHAIAVSDGRARIGPECRVCGRCASICPSEAIKIEITDPEFLEKSYERIRSYVKYE